MRYMTKGWFSHETHKTESCSSCHAAAKSMNADELLLPDIDSCRSCHGGEASNAKVPSSCALCHSYHFAAGAPWISAVRNARSKTGLDMARAPGRPGT
jgi:predicted CXXCH cytochrome family protein